MSLSASAPFSAGRGVSTGFHEEGWGATSHPSANTKCPNGLGSGWGAATDPWDDAASLVKAGGGHPPAKEKSWDGALTGTDDGWGADLVRAKEDPGRASGGSTESKPSGAAGVHGADRRLPPPFSDDTGWGSAPIHTEASWGACVGGAEAAWGDSPRDTGCRGTPSGVDSATTSHARNTAQYGNTPDAQEDTKAESKVAAMRAREAEVNPPPPFMSPPLLQLALLCRVLSHSHLWACETLDGWTGLVILDLWWTGSPYSMPHPASDKFVRTRTFVPFPGPLRLIVPRVHVTCCTDSR